MRRAEKDITHTDTLLDILKRNTVVHLALTDGTEPYGVTVNYGFDSEANTIYIHSAPEGRKIEMMENNPVAAFTIIDSAQTAPADTACTWTAHYTSVMGVAEVQFLDEPGEKRHGLSMIMDQHGGPKDFDDAAIGACRVIALIITSISAKQSPPPPSSS